MRKRITRGLIAILAIVMSATAQAQNPTSGTAGPLTWKYDTGTKTLTISGKGDMPNYVAENPAPWQSLNKEVLKLVVEEGVTGIGNNAFRYASKLISVTLPTSLTRIGHMTFIHCWNLPMVKLPAGITHIGDEAFKGCDSLVLDSLPAALQEIGAGAFSWCKKLSAVTIPAGVKKIGKEAFAGCSSLLTITVEDGNANYIVVDGVLFNKEKTTLVQYPAGRVATSYVIPKEVTSIGEYAFNSAENLTAVTIPAGVISIGEWAFSNCSKLTSITIPAAVKEIGA